MNENLTKDILVFFGPPAVPSKRSVPRVKKIKKSVKLTNHRYFVCCVQIVYACKTSIFSKTGQKKVPDRVDVKFTSIAFQ